MKTSTQVYSKNTLIYYGFMVWFIYLATIIKMIVIKKMQIIENRFLKKILDDKFCS